MFRNYRGVVKVDGDVGKKKNYAPRYYSMTAEAAMGRSQIGGTGVAGGEEFLPPRKEGVRKILESMPGELWGP